MSTYTPQHRRQQSRPLLAADWAWILAFGLLAALLGYRAASAAHNSRAVWLVLVWMPLISAGTYLSAFSLRDRYAAVVAAALVATSGTLAAMAAQTPSVGAAMACVAVVWWLIEQGRFALASIVCCVAFACRPEMLLLGVVVLAFGVVQRRPQAGIAAAILVVAIAGWLAMHLLIFKRPFLPTDGAIHNRYIVLSGFGPMILWFLTAFITDLANRATRHKWLPLLTWVILYGCAGCILQRSGSSHFLAPAFLAAYIICSAGIARVLPALSGDLPTTSGRYLVAVVAVLLLIVLRFPNDEHTFNELNHANAGKLTTEHR